MAPHRFMGAAWSGARLLAAGIALGLWFAAPAGATPLLFVPVTADVGSPVTVALQEFPAGVSVDVWVRPSGGGNCCGIQVADHVVTDGAGRAAVTFTWPGAYHVCAGNADCMDESWRLGGLADVEASTTAASAVALNTTRIEPPGTPPVDLTVAQRFRPLLEFDSSERWRPLQIDRFFAYDRPVLCGIGCHRTPWASLLQSFGVPPWHLDMPGQQTDADSYVSSLATCHANGLVDCDAGPETAIYVHDVTHEGYRYLDYWWFLRFNHAPFTKLYYDEHEGDWEGATVAVPAGLSDPQRFDFVAVAAHKGVWRYLRDALLCEDAATHAPASCGPAAPRVKVFVADGTHAGYPQPCRKILFFYCRQTGTPLPEKGFDGRRPWGANDDADDLLAFGPAWEDWAGNWNSNPDHQVSSPGRQARYQHPWQVTCSDRFSLLLDCASAGASRAAADSGDCNAWFGPFAAATACDPQALGIALRQGTLGEPGALRLTLNGSASASAPGLAQAIGTPLQPGQTLHVEGAAAPGTQLLVRAQDADEVLSARYTDLGLEAGGTLTVRAARSGEHVALLATDSSGRPLQPRGRSRQPTSRRPPRPARVSARRRGSHVAVTLRAATRRVMLQPQRRRRAGAISSRTRHVRPGRRVTVRMPAGRRARYVSVAAIAAGGLPSSPVVVRIR